jgi:TolB protein
MPMRPLRLGAVCALAALVTATTGGAARSAFPGRNGSIAFEAYRAPQGIYVVSPRGGPIRLLPLQETCGSSVLEPAWSANGSRIAYVVLCGDGDVAIADADGSNGLVLPTGAGSDMSPSWSPDGRHLLFSKSTQSAISEIWRIGTDGRGAVQLTHLGASTGAPHYSPDGGHITFSTNVDGNSEIYVMRSDGTHLRNLTRNPSSDTFPDWSPDGRRIAFSSDRSGTLQLWVMRADGTGARQVTHVSPGANAPAWSPDGRRLAFNTTFDSATGAQGHIFSIGVDGTGLRQLSRGKTVLDCCASWRPR